uniref:Putative secreted protein n=1 Tax=Nyssomyia neivai TaxID=330878 RepID=A0A1L8DNT1_9DIPT
MRKFERLQGLGASISSCTSAFFMTLLLLLMTLFSSPITSFFPSSIECCFFSGSTTSLSSSIFVRKANSFSIYRSRRFSSDCSNKFLWYPSSRSELITSASVYGSSITSRITGLMSTSEMRVVFESD